MKLKVNYLELENLRKTSENNKDQLDEVIEKLLESLERIRNGIWQGEDSEIFYSNCYTYISKMKVLSGFMDTTTTFMKNASNKYEGEDNTFTESMKQEVNLLDEERNIY